MKGLFASLLCVPLAFGVLAGCGDNATGGGDTEGDGQHEGTDGPETPAQEGEISFTDMSETAVLDPYAQNALEKEISYLLSLEPDRLLYNFRENAGISVKNASRYGGWEDSLIAGHTMGHYLTAIAQAYANGGTSEASKKLLDTRIKVMINSLQECQYKEDNAETGAKAGFLWGANATNHKKEVEFQFDNVEKNRTNITTEAWVPWYTMHKLLAGLIDVYNLAGNERALEVAKGLGDWVANRVGNWSEATRKTVLSIEYGGMNDALYNLYAVTGDVKYAVAAHQFDEDIPTQGTFASSSMIARIIDEDENYLRGQHANTTIPKIIGLLNCYIRTNGKTVEGVTNAKGRLSTKVYLDAAEKFWTRVVEHHTYATGGNSNDEHFQADDSQWAIRSNINCETCNVYNMLKLTRMLFSVTKDKKYLDYYENAYINTILSSQNPETGMTTYFQAMAPGYFKVYSSEFNHFWCCTGSGMESMSKLNDSIYYDAEGATYIAMYLSSTYTSDAVSLKTTADLETSDTVTIEITEGATTLKLRRPDWTTKFALQLNGKDVSAAEDDFASVEVKKGDTVTLTLGKNITVHTLPNAKGVYAFKYGPYVLSERLGTENMTTTSHGVQVLKAASAVIGKTSYQTEGNDLAAFRANINSLMTRNADGTFTLKGVEGGPLTYVIHYKQYTNRYAVYLTFEGEEEGTEPDVPTVETEEIEAVIQPGRGQYEGGGFLEDNGSTGSDADGRYANAKGSFSYWVGVDKSAPESNYIMTSLVKADNGKTLKMSSNGTVFYQKTLNFTGKDDIYDVCIPIPSTIVNAAAENEKGDPAVKATRIKVTVESAKAGEPSAALHTYFKTVKIAKTHDASLAYFVDCGDYNVNTLSAGDKFGLCNSVTEQAYGTDPLTGMMWGVWDEATADTWDGGVPVEGSVATNSTWAQENQNPPVDDGAAKTQTNRYTKNQFEKGWQTLKIAYKFELADGTYRVELYFANPWNCSGHVDVSANGTKVLNDVATGSAVTCTVTVTGGELLLEFTNPVNTAANDLCINIGYIKILYT